MYTFTRALASSKRWHIIVQVKNIAKAQSRQLAMAYNILLLTHTQETIHAVNKIEVNSCKLMDMYCDEI